MDILSITNKESVSADAKVYTKDGNDFVTTTFDALYKNSSAKTNIEKSVSDANARIDNTNNTVAELDNYARAKANGIVLQSQGEMVTVNDSSDDYVVNLKPYGKSEQDSTTGANLADLSTSNLANCTYDNGIYTSTALGAYGTMRIQTVTPINIKADTTYYLKAKIKKVSGDGDYNVMAVYELPGAKVTGETLTTEYQEFICRFSSTIEQTLTPLVMVQVDSESSNLVISVKDIMICSDKDATYEPYTGGKPSPNPDYPQEIRSTVISEIKTVEKNWLNLTNGVDYSEQGIAVTNNKNGSYSVSGTSTTTWLKSIISVELKAGIAFVLNGGVSDKVQLSLRNSNGATIYLGDLENSANSEYTPSEDMTAYLYVRVGNGITVNETIYPMLRVKGTDATYEPYTETVAQLSEPITLYGIATTSGGNFTDSNGQQWIADYIDTASGKVVRNVKQLTINNVIPLGLSSDGIKWRVRSEYFLDSSLVGMGAVYNRVMNDKFTQVDHVTAEDESSGTCMSAFGHATGLEFRFRLMVSEYATEEEASNIVMGTIVNYPLATPTEEDLSTNDIVALKNLKTFYGITHVMNDSEVKGEMVLFYNADTKMYIDNKFAELAAQLV